MSKHNALDVRMRAVIMRMVRYGDGTTSDPTRAPSNRKLTKATWGAPPDTQPMAVDWQERFRRMIESAERAADQYERRGQHALTRSTQRRKRIASSQTYVGIDATLVAYWEGVPERRVRDIRKRAGLDPTTGEQEQVNALTARPEVA